MRNARCYVTACMILGSVPCAFADVPTLPTNAKALTTKDSIVKALTSGPRKVTGYDDKGKTTFSVEATYDWPTKTINVREGSEKLQFKWDVKGGKYCVRKEPCRSLYSDGNRIFEINPDGKLHAVHEPM